MTTSVENCGDNLVVGKELCDDGNVHCLAGCLTSENGWHCTLAGAKPTTTICAEQCGDGYITPSEECEDGNLNTGDGCTNLCKFEVGWDHTLGTSPHPSSFLRKCGD